MTRLFFSLAFILVVVAGMLSGVAEAAVTCPTSGSWSIVAGVCVPTDSGLPANTVSAILETFMKWLLGILGFLGVIAFVISGIQYLTSAGDDDTISTAKRNMKYSIIGVVVALSGYIIIQAVTTALSGTSIFF